MTGAAVRQRCRRSVRGCRSSQVRRPDLAVAVAEAGGAGGQQQGGIVAGAAVPAACGPRCPAGPAGAAGGVRGTSARSGPGFRCRPAPPGAPRPAHRAGTRAAPSLVSVWRSSSRPPACSVRSADHGQVQVRVRLGDDGGHRALSGTGTRGEVQPPPPFPSPPEPSAAAEKTPAVVGGRAARDGPASRRTPAAAGPASPGRPSAECGTGSPSIHRSGRSGPRSAPQCSTAGSPVGEADQQAGAGAAQV